MLEKAKVQDEDAALPVFRETAARLGIELVIGSLAIKIDEAHCANRSFFISRRGEVIASYDKIHLFDVELGKGKPTANRNDSRPAIVLKSSRSTKWLSA